MCSSDLSRAKPMKDLGKPGWSVKPGSLRSEVCAGCYNCNPRKGRCENDGEAHEGGGVVLPLSLVVKHTSNVSIPAMVYATQHVFNKP